MITHHYHLNVTLIMKNMAVRSRKDSRSFLFFLILGSWFLTACSTQVDSPQGQFFIQETYQKALMAYEDELFKEAQTGFEKIIEQNPGTRFASQSYLKLGDLHFQTTEWEKSETNYRLFLTLNPNSLLTPYVLNRLIELNYKRNFQGLFVENRDFERDMEPNRRIIQEYQRFFFLYPNSAYLQESKEYLRQARNDLAEYEFLVGNFYFERQAYTAAISRYLYLLKNFPEYTNTEAVGLKLLSAYEANQQPHLASEMKKAMGVRFNQAGNL